MIWNFNNVKNDIIRFFSIKGCLFHLVVSIYSLVDSPRQRSYVGWSLGRYKVSFHTASGSIEE